MRRTLIALPALAAAAIGLAACGAPVNSATSTPTSSLDCTKPMSQADYAAKCVPDDQVTIPTDLIGKPARLAAKKLSARGLSPQCEDVDYNPTSCDSSASVLSIAFAGQNVPRGTTVDVRINAGTPSTTTPSSSGPSSSSPTSTTPAPGAASDTDAAPPASPQLNNAISAAKNYLSMTGFSKKELIQQLSSKYGDQYPTSVATKAVESLNVNWKQQAVKSAKNYLSMTHFSKAGLIQQLESPYGDQYTHAQAVYGATQAMGQ